MCSRLRHKKICTYTKDSKGEMCFRLRLKDLGHIPGLRILRSQGSLRLCLGFPLMVRLDAGFAVTGVLKTSKSLSV